MSGDVKKKIKPGLIEVHPEELAIVVNYEVQEMATQPDGTAKMIGKENTTKKISVKTLAPGTDIPALAAEIVDKCKLIHPSKVGQVEELLKALQARGGAPAPPSPKNGKAPPAVAAAPAGKAVAAAPAKAPPASPGPKGAAPPASPGPKGAAAAAPPSPGPKGAAMAAPPSPGPKGAPKGPVMASQIFKVQQKQYDPAYLKNLDDYIEDLYDEEMNKKVRATGMIAQLFRNTENFESLLSHETLLQTLSRILREDSKRSIDLCINIVSVFFAVSNFSQFHGLIMDNQVGALTMDLVDLEIKRTEHRAQEEGISPAMVAQKALEASTGKVALGDREKKLMALIQKQDRLLYICFYMLLNLSEDVGIEKKMKKKNIVVYLVKMLERSNVELLILATTFLKKLSIYKENKDKMNECRITEKLAKFVPVRNDVLLMSVLRLLHNLSFDSRMRDDLVKQGFIPKAVELMTTPRFQPVVLGLLYHVSMDDKYKTMFTYTDAVAKMYDMIVRVQDLRNTPELIALAVNLTQNQRNAEVMTEGERFDRLIKRAFQTCDELAFKVLRNLGNQDNVAIRQRFKPYVEQMVLLLKAPDITAELFVEVLGCLANLYIPEFDFLGLVHKHDLLQFLATYAQPGAVDDDILLEVVMFVGVLCNEGTAPLLVGSGLVNTLFVLMGEKKEDDEFVLQIAFSFNKFMMYEDTRKALLEHTQVVYYLVDLLQDKNQEVRRVADNCLDIIMDANEEWAVKIRNLKFESCNQEWLDFATSGGGGAAPAANGNDGEEDDQDGGYDAIAGHRIVADFDDYTNGGDGDGANTWANGGGDDDDGGYEGGGAAAAFEDEEFKNGGYT